MNLSNVVGYLASKTLGLVSETESSFAISTPTKVGGAWYYLEHW